MDRQRSQRSISETTKKHVSNYDNGAPRLLQQFEYEIDSLADTHRWIHGDPRKELIGNVRADAAFAKPGLTALMRAAAVADTGEMQRLLAAKSDPNAQDSSGWTALVYSAQGEKKDSRR
jgi:ankyrin repeat protein